jgi:hypothetical protein
MEITVSDSAEFKRLLEALVYELIDANDYFRLHQDLNADIQDYQVEFNQSAAFWTFTTRALMDASLIRLCRAYDPLDSKPNLTLRNFLDTIHANLHFFDEPNFRERLKANPFVDSLAAAPRKPDATQLQNDLVAVSSADPSVKKLITWRHMYFAHRSYSSALNLGVFTTQNFFLFAEIKALIDNGLRIVNFYSSLFSAEAHTSFPVKDYKYLLDAVRRDLKAQEAAHSGAVRRCTS